ncbi:MAG: chemotaxis protein CheX [Phenylobacterium zucineum]|nr:MAG: chemotaxis protein CheX [Phenylobacterium zucineum]
MTAADAATSPHRLSLIPNLDLQAAEPLRAELMALRGRPLTIDAADVNRLGGLCLQVLISARKIWSEDGHAFTVERASSTFSDQLAGFGGPDLNSPLEGSHT